MPNDRLEEKEGQTEKCARQRAGVAKAGTEQAGPVQAHPELVPWGPTNDQPKFRDAAGLEAQGRGLPRLRLCGSAHRAKPEILSGRRIVDLLSASSATLGH